MTEKRAYHLKSRAVRQDETRRRIVEATVTLHEEIGPSETTITAIAERAGVERITVYRNFPDDADLYAACQYHFLAAHPYPEVATWEAISDPVERLRRALNEMYARHRVTEAMTAHILRDAPGIPALAARIKDIPRYYRAAAQLLADPFAPVEERRPLLLAVIGHALDFETWRSLTRRQGLTDAQAVNVMVILVQEADARA